MAVSSQSQVYCQMAVHSVENENFYKDLDPILDEINRKSVKMDKDLKQKYVKITLEVVQIVIEQMKTVDEVFNKLFSKLDYVGSYFDGLRVAKPTEFDLNVIMKMPCDYNKIKIDNTNVTAGSIKINISDAINDKQHPENIIRTVKKWCDNNGYLLESRAREWMEGVFSRYLGHQTKKIDIPSGETVNVKLRKNGPAFTLTLYVWDDIIDVDLVFAIQFPASRSPPSSIRWTSNLADSWVVITKPAEDRRFWRISFTNSERKLTLKQYKLKLINRLLKAMRDARPNLKNLSSYLIKTLFLWEAHECTTYSRTRFWEKRQGYLFIYMLDKLFSVLNEYRLPYYWHKKSNLLLRLPECHVKNMANEIRRIILKINDFIKKQDKERLRYYVLALFQISEVLAIADHSLEDRGN